MLNIETAPLNLPIRACPDCGIDVTFPLLRCHRCGIARLKRYASGELTLRDPNACVVCGAMLAPSRKASGHKRCSDIACRPTEPEIVQCRDCGTGIERKSPSQRYCGACKDERERKRKAADWERRKAKLTV